MRILMLTKRQYMGKDLLLDRYGRFFELPRALAALGHEVEVVMGTYRPRGEETRSTDGVRWHSVDVLPFPWRCLRKPYDVARTLQPQLILATADAPQLVLGARLARRLALPLVLDLYDDFESYGLTRLPGLRSALRCACAAAAALCTVSHTLADILATRGRLPGALAVIGNGLPVDFVPASGREAAREALGLPLGLPLIGTVGALAASRGITDLFEAYTQLKLRVPGLKLVLAGPRDAASARLIPAGAIDLGELDYAQVPLVLRSLDVGVVCNRDSLFGRACHPQKLVEMTACRVPLVAAAVGETARLLALQPACLYPPGDARMLAARIEAQLMTPTLADPGLADSWDEQGRKLAALLELGLEKA